MGREGAEEEREIGVEGFCISPGGGGVRERDEYLKLIQDTRTGESRGS